MKLRPYQIEAVAAIEREWQSVDSTLLVLPTGCHDPQQPILMFDGSIKSAESIRIGNCLMGPDSKPRRVLAVHTGRSQMYRVIPVKGEPFIVTHDHMLTLIRTNEKQLSKVGGQIVDVKVSDWLQWPAWRKHIHKLMRVGVDFPDFSPNWWDEFHPDPYVLGVLLGDGSLRTNLSITSEDDEITQAVAQEIYKFNLFLVPFQKCGRATTFLIKSITPQKRNVDHFRKWLNVFGLNMTHSGNKFIPEDYKTGSRSDRLQILAGLLDTDGSMSCGGYDYISKSRQLSADVVFVARSLGLAAYMKRCKKYCQTGGGGIYWRVSISGDCSCIPCRVPKKKPPVRCQKKSVLRTGFTIEPVGKGPYCGFTVDGDNRYLMGDFTVTHNCGKTICLAEIIRRAFPRRALVLAHREELIFQAVDKVSRVTGFRCDVEMAEYRAELSDLLGGPQVVVSTIQTQTSGADGGGRMSRFDPSYFGLVVVDESHHSTAKSYRRCLDYYRQNPRLKILGVTATPDRADEEALGQVYETVAFDYEILDAINDGWLAPVEQQMVSVSDLDYSSCRTTAGDLNGADLAQVMEDEKALHGIAAPTLEMTQGKRSLVFASSVAHAERLAEIFNRHRDGCAAWLCGKTNKEDRRKILASFVARKIQYVVNVGVLTEGFDDPGVECIVMGRPTKSRALYAQMIGRAMRPLPGIVDGLDDAAIRRASIASSKKPSCLVIDFVGNAGRHKLVTTADILGGKNSDEAIAAAVKEAKESGQPIRMDEAIAAAEAELERAKRAAAKRAQLTAKARWNATQVDPFDTFGITPARERGWDTGRMLSDKQRTLLERQGIDTSQLTYSQGRQLLSEIFKRWDKGLCSFKQARILRKYGYGTNMSREEASQTLDHIFSRRPMRAAPVNKKEAAYV